MSQQTVHGLIAANAARRPDAVAIDSPAGSVTYGLLDAAADDFAAELQAHGVRPGDVVPVCLPRGRRLITTLLAISKCGAAYSVLDERWPADRVGALVRTVGARLGVGTAPIGPVPVLAPPADLAATAARGRRPEPVPVGGDDPFAVFFTSGSTGEPKGVVSPHAGTVRLFTPCRFAPMGPDTVMPQLAPAPWDGFVLDCWGVLIAGGTTVLVDEPVLVPAALRRLVAEHGVTGIFLTTTLFNLLVGADVDAFAGMSWVITGGERASQPLMRRFLDTHPGIALSNVYGPVEATALVMAHPVRAGDCDDPHGVPLGTAILDGEVHLVDGEICVSGAGLAAGYLGDPELTADRFTEVDTASGRTRVYRTGDLARDRGDGILYFAGRADRQLKVRGHRIEPAEIERAADAVPGVTATAVIPVPGPDGRPESLALFYVAAPDSGIDEPALRDKLAGTLPPYLVPDSVRRLATLPVLATGKTDRRALSRLLPARPEYAGGDGPDRGTTEELVRDAFAAALGIPPPGRDVSLFALGGTSLTAAELCVRLRERTGVDVPPSRIFADPTVAGVAGWLDTVTRTAAEDEASGSEAVALPLHYAFYLWEDRGAAADTAYVCPLAWWVAGDLDHAALTAALGDVHRRHEALRARYTAEPGPTARVPDLLGDEGVELARLAPAATEAAAVEALRAALIRPMTISAGEIWRAAVVPVTGGRTLLGLVVHHVAADAAAESVLAADLGTAYAARLGGAAPAFARPAARLHEIAAEQRRRLALADPQRQLSYWDAELAGLPELELAERRPTEASAGTRDAAVRELTEAEVAVWRAHARDTGTPLLAVLAGVYATAIRELSGSEEVAVMVPVSRRTGHPEATVTCRVDMLCLRLRASDEPLAQAAATVGAALANQDVPFLEAAGGLFRSGRGHTILSLPVLLVQNDPEPVLTLPGCRVTPQPLPARTTMTELECQVRTAGDRWRIEVAVWTDRLPVSFAHRLADEMLRVLHRGPRPALTAVTP